MTDVWRGPTLRQEQRFWCVDYRKHAGVTFGVGRVCLWRDQAGLFVLGLKGGSFSGVVWHLPGEVPHGLASACMMPWLPEVGRSCEGHTVTAAPGGALMSWASRAAASAIGLLTHATPCVAQVHRRPRSPTGHVLALASHLGHTPSSVPHVWPHMWPCTQCRLCCAGASAPAFSPDGHVLALVSQGRVELRLCSSMALLAAWVPHWQYPPNLPAPSGFQANALSWGGAGSRTLLVKSLSHHASGSRLLLSALTFA